jgi:hypothetical protein
MGALLTFVAMAACGSSAAAQPGDEMIRDLAGTWQIIPTDGRPACAIALTATSNGSGRWSARPDPSCAARVPAAQEGSGEGTR